MLTANSPLTFTSMALQRLFCPVVPLRDCLSGPIEFFWKAKKHPLQMSCEVKFLRQRRRWRIPASASWLLATTAYPADAANTDIEQEIVLVGIIGFIDPPRREVGEAIRTCQQAGIRVIMITGDHPETAKTIAGQVGINNARVLTGNEMAAMTDDALKDALRNTHVFARVTPEDKLRLVRLLKENGEIVAVTGDGINDAPALKEAHIGIAMGVRGTDVAKEAASMILVDDNFATIETAVSEGRRLYSNLRKGVRYYLACKVALGINLPCPNHTGYSIAVCANPNHRARTLHGLSCIRHLRR